MYQYLQVGNSPSSTYSYDLFPYPFQSRNIRSSFVIAEQTLVISKVCEALLAFSHGRRCRVGFSARRCRVGFLARRSLRSIRGARSQKSVHISRTDLCTLPNAPKHPWQDGRGRIRVGPCTTPLKEDFNTYLNLQKIFEPDSNHVRSPLFLPIVLTRFLFFKNLSLKKIVL